MALIAILVKLDSRGPVLSHGQQIGEGGHMFVLKKFRSMSFHANPRVTRVGRWLRRTRLDELPMQWNILMGDLSFYGYRRRPR